MITLKKLKEVNFFKQIPHILETAKKLEYSSLKLAYFDDCRTNVIYLIGIQDKLNLNNELHSSDLSIYLKELFGKKLKVDFNDNITLSHSCYFDDPMYDKGEALAAFRSAIELDQLSDKIAIDKQFLAQYNKNINEMPIRYVYDYDSKKNILVSDLNFVPDSHAISLSTFPTEKRCKL